MRQDIWARALRPQSFADIIGQREVVDTIRGILDTQKLHPAILLYGLRGSGKTSMARIISKSLNCAKGIVSEPCLKCDSCKMIASGNHIDVMELDAASRTKVEDIKEWLEVIPYAPSVGRFRVIILDEAHMLSRHSFNALLKVIEEPPKHVQFIFATTEHHKMPETVRSRTLQLHFKAIDEGSMTDYLSSILNREGIAHTREFCRSISIRSGGSVRDALNYMQQITARGIKPGDEVLDIAMNASCSVDAFSLESWGLLERGEYERLFERVDSEGLSFASADQLLKGWIGIVNRIYTERSLLNLGAGGIDFGRWGSIEKSYFERTRGISTKVLWMVYQSLLSMRKELSLGHSPCATIQMYITRLAQFFALDTETPSLKKK